MPNDDANPRQNELKSTPGSWWVTDADQSGGTGRKTASYINAPSLLPPSNPGLQEFSILAEVWGPPPVPAEERKANARVMAASKELYAALIGCLQLCREEFNDNDSYAAPFMDAAEEALAKARGESPLAPVNDSESAHPFEFVTSHPYCNKCGGGRLHPIHLGGFHAR